MVQGILNWLKAELPVHLDAMPGKMIKASRFRVVNAIVEEREQPSTFRGKLDGTKLAKIFVGGQNNAEEPCRALGQQNYWA